MTRLEVDISPGSSGTPPRISVLNDGACIPVELHSGEGVYVPELVLGQLLTGSNFGGGEGDDSKPKQGSTRGGSSPSRAADASSGAVTGGRHGYGAKLTNIFSSEFTVETADSRAGKLYVQTWTRNMRQRGEPAITALPPGTRDYTRISFTPDLALFGQFSAGIAAGSAAPASGSGGAIDAGTLALMYRRVVDAAGTIGMECAQPQTDEGADGACAPAAKGGRGSRASAKAAAAASPAPAAPPVTVILNGKTVPVRSFLEYARLYCPPQLPSKGTAAATAGPDITGDGESVETLSSVARRLSALAYARLDRRWEVVVGAAGLRIPAQAPDAQHFPLSPQALELYSEPCAVSFVNGMHTSRGGTHETLVMDQLTRRLAEVIQKRLGSPSAAGGITITPAHVRPHLRLFVNARIPDPSFDSQAKEQLVTPAATFLGAAAPAAAAVGKVGDAPPLWFSDKFIMQVADDLGVAAAVIDAARARAAGEAARVLKRSTRTTEGKVKAIPKLEDANWAGTRRAHECTLILTEGDSAKALAVAGLAVVGRDRFGVFPLKGKFLNVRDLSARAALENTEVAALVQILGLDFTREYAGMRPEERGLRYGRVLIMADQDVDGSHIKGLIANMFHTFWPRLLENPPGPLEASPGAAGNAAAADEAPAGGRGARGTSKGAGGPPSADGGPLSSQSFLQQFITPILKARRGASTREFFSVREYARWRSEGIDARGQPSAGSDADRAATEARGRVFGEANAGSRWSVKYYKGLGTSTSAEARTYFSDLRRHVIPFVWGGPSDAGKLEMAFAKAAVDQRKAWLTASSADTALLAAATSPAEAANAPAAAVVDLTATALPAPSSVGEAAGAIGALATGLDTGLGAIPVSLAPDVHTGIAASAPDAAPSSVAAAPSNTSANGTTFASFVDSELIEFSRADLVRSVPSVLDGLKPSQRKVLFACFKRAGGGGTSSGAGLVPAQSGIDLAAADSTTASPPPPPPAAVSRAIPVAAPPSPPATGSEVKVAQLAGYVSEQTAYHHGEASLVATVVKMAQDFPGANNLPLLAPLGQFGTRLQGGKDAASARYIFTKLSPFARLLFPASDDVLLRHREDDGLAVEPVAYVPIVPLVLVNGAEGIGTGWSTQVPQYHPRRVMDAVARSLDAYENGLASASSAVVEADLLQAAAALPLLPWWRGFTGAVSHGPVGSGAYNTEGRAAWTTHVGSAAELRQPPSARKPSAKGRKAPSAGAKGRSAAAARIESDDSDADEGSGGGHGGAAASGGDDEVAPHLASAWWRECREGEAQEGPGGAMHVRISELPVGRWTEDYKAFLQGLVSDGTLKGLREYHTESRVEFVVTLTPEGAKAAWDATAAPYREGAASGKPRRRGADRADGLPHSCPPDLRLSDGLATLFRLRDRGSLRNMHLFDPRGAIRLYDSPAAVVSEFVPLRYGLYAARKLRQERFLATALAKDQARVRFLSEVVSGQMVVGRVPRERIERALWQGGFPAFTDNDESGGSDVTGTSAAAPGGARGLPASLQLVLHLLEPTSLEPPRVLVSTAQGAPSAAPARAFDYLLNLPIWQLSEGSLADASRKAADTQAALARAKACDPGSLWRAELGHLAHALAADPAFKDV